jgi:hypothetical protein
MNPGYKCFILIAGLLVASCNKDFLDKKPYNSVLLSDAIKSEADLSTTINGAYSELRLYALFGTFLPVKGDLMSDNTFVTTTGRNFIEQNTFSFTNISSEPLDFWSAAYIAIKYANTVINNTLGLTTANANQYLGEAYAIRALVHFELVRNFATAYTIDKTKPGIPIVTSYDQNALPSRKTVEQVYVQILSDLDKAYSLMTVYRGTAYFSKYAARALQARVYQNMGDWASAKTASLDVINNSGWVLLTPSDYVSPSGSLGTVPDFSTYSPGGYWANTVPQTTTRNETLFEISADIVDNNGLSQLGSFYLQAGGGIGEQLATDDLYNLYSATDVRKGLCVRAPAGYRTGQDGNINLCYKYPNAFNKTNVDDNKIIRLSDIILIAAEAYYNTNDEINARIMLNKVAKQRDPSFAGYNSTGAQLLSDILNERRKELAFEGSRFWDLIRLKKNWTKISNQNPLITVAASPSHYAALYPIPYTELTANPNIVQNPGY